MYQARTTLPPATPPAPHRGRKKLFMGLYIAIALLLVVLGIFFGNKALAPDAASSKKNANQDTPAAPQSFDKKRLSTTDPASIWVVINKQHQLQPKEYAPTDLVFPNVPLRVPGNESMQLRREVATALEQLVAGATAAGLDLMLASGYRSYDYQMGLYNGYVKSIGVAEADKTSARPGHSEHQTGLALDLEPANRDCELDQCFGDLPEGKWVAEHAPAHGFIIRYTKTKTAITGYEYEPWHLRYVGKELAAELKKQNIETLEEFFGIPGGQNY